MQLKTEVLPKKGKRQILVIDENRGDYVLISNYLKNSYLVDFDVQFNNSLYELYDSLDVIDHSLDTIPFDPISTVLIMLDVKYLGKSPEENFKNVKALFPDCPIIAIAEFFSEELSDLAGRMGAYGILEKQDLTQERVINSVSHCFSLQNNLKAVYEKANYDALTGLANRSLFFDRVEHAISRSVRTNTCNALLIIDMDDFKGINDHYGHDIGDLFLQEIAARQLNCVRKSDTVSRLGGDEFAILLEGLASPGIANLVAKKILESCCEAMFLKGNKIVPSMSIGISTLSNDNSNRFSSDWLFKSADTALYRAKHAGKNTYVVFTDADDHQMIRTLALEDQLIHAVKNNEFLLHYQPIFHSDTKVLAGFEALLRWRKSKDDLVLPDEFIGVLERLGLMKEVGERVMKDTLEQYAKWREVGMERVTMHINIAPGQFISDSFSESLKQNLESLQISPEDVSLELTERHLFSSSKNLDRELNKLHLLGVGVAIDDFGTGHSSYDYLKRFNIETIKLDKSFIHAMFESPIDMAIIHSIIKLSQDLGINIVAEGIESTEQMDYLIGHGVDEIQGFLLGRPLEAIDCQKRFCSKKPAVEDITTLEKTKQILTSA
ncbi:MAG: EAL domain-containing protein [Gammaproteobacteria bacterium]